MMCNLSDDSSYIRHTQNIDTYFKLWKIHMKGTSGDDSTGIYIYDVQRSDDSSYNQHNQDKKIICSQYTHEGHIW